MPLPSRPPPAVPPRTPPAAPLRHSPAPRGTAPPPLTYPGRPPKYMPRPMAYTYMSWGGPVGPGGLGGTTPKRGPSAQNAEAGDGAPPRQPLRVPVTRTTPRRSLWAPVHRSSTGQVPFSVSVSLFFHLSISAVQYRICISAERVRTTRGTVPIGLQPSCVGLASHLDGRHSFLVLVTRAAKRNVLSSDAAPSRAVLRAVH